MGRSIKLGKAFGIGIYVHWTFLLLLGMVFYLSYNGSVQGSLVVVLFLLSLFGCVLLHELGHALTARHFGISTRDITLLPIGGVARLERMSEKPWEEFWIAVAGPLVNVGIAAVLFLALVILVAMGGMDVLAGVPRELTEIPGIPAHAFVPMILVGLLGMNLQLVVFNLIPAFPMDGGRIFRAILSSYIGFRQATEAAALVGMVMAGLIALWGFEVMRQTFNPLVMLVGLFVLVAGQQELFAVRYRDAQRRAAPIDVLPGDASWAPSLPPLVLPVPPLSPPEPNFSGFTWDRQLGAWIEWRAGQAVAINGQWRIYATNGEWGTGNGEPKLATNGERETGNGESKSME